MESRLLPDLLRPGSVVALGGGAPIDDANWKVIVERSTTVFIDCGFDTIWDRIKDATTRPLMTGRSRDELEALLATDGGRDTWKPSTGSTATARKTSSRRRS